MATKKKFNEAKGLIGNMEQDAQYMHAQKPHAQAKAWNDLEAEEAKKINRQILNFQEELKKMDENNPNRKQILEDIEFLKGLL